MTQIIISSPIFVHANNTGQQLRIREQGFSMVEMIVVMGIIAIMLAITIPNLMPQRFKVRSAAFNLRSHLMQARTEAVRTNNDVYIDVDEVNDCYNSSAIRHVQMSDSVDLDLPNDTDSIRLTFSPIGTISKSSGSTTYTIVVNGTNGMCEVRIRRSGRIYIDGNCPK